MFQHKFFENLDENTVKKHLDFALNNIDQLLFLNTPQEKQNFINQYFIALTTLVILFNDRQSDLDLLLDMNIDSSKLLNLLQKISFYKELRESPYLVQFQKQVNLYLETYPNEITTQFLHIIPIKALKFDKKKSRKEIIYKLFRKKERKTLPIQNQPSITINGVTSSPKTNLVKAPITNNNSNFFTRLFNKSSSSQKEIEKTKARAVFEKIQNKPTKLINSVQDQNIKTAEKEKEERILNQKITQQRKTEVKTQSPETTQTEKLKNFNKKQNLLDKIRISKEQNSLREKSQKLILPEIRLKSPKTKDYELKEDEGWTFMDNLILHQNQIVEKINEIQNTKNRKIESYQEYKEQNKSNIEKFFNKIFTKRSKPIYSPQQMEKLKNEANKRGKSEIELIMKGNQVNTNTKPSVEVKETPSNPTFFYKFFRDIAILKNHLKDFVYRNYTYKNIQARNIKKQQEDKITKEKIKTDDKSFSKLDQKTVSQQALEAVKLMDAQTNKEEIIRDLVTQSKLKAQPTKTILNSQDLKNIIKNPKTIEEANKIYVEQSKNQTINKNNQNSATNEKLIIMTGGSSFFTKIIDFIKNFLIKSNNKTISTVREVKQKQTKPKPLELINERPTKQINTTEPRKIIINQNIFKQTKPIQNNPTSMVLKNTETSKVTKEKDPIKLTVNPLFKLIEYNYSDFLKSVENISKYPDEIIEELISKFEKILLSKQKDLFLNFENLDSNLISILIETHSKFLSKKSSLNSNNIIETISKYNILLEYLDHINKINDLKIKYTNVDKIKDFILSQYISFRFKQNLFARYLAEFQLEKIYSNSEIKLNGQKQKKISDIPIKIFEVENLLIKDKDNNIDIIQTRNKEQQFFEITILMTIHSYIDIFSDSISKYLKEESRKNITFLLNSNLKTSLSKVASEVFLNTYCFNIYKNIGQGNIKHIKEHFEKKFKKIANEFLTDGYSESDNIGFISDLYFNLNRVISEVSNFSKIQTDELIEEVIKAVCIQIIEWRVIPDNFYSLKFRNATDDEKISAEIKYALDINLIENYQNEFQTEEYFETYIFTYSIDSIEKVNSLTTVIDKNPDYINKIINIALNKSTIKEKIADLTNKIKYDVNKDISLAKDLI